MSRLHEQNNTALEMTAVVDNRTNRFQVNKVAVPATNAREIAENTGSFANDDEDEEEEEDDFETGNLLSKGSSDIVHDTKYGKSFRLMTREALPREDNYRHVMSLQAALRPTLDELHDATLTSSNKPSTTVQFEDEQFDSANGVGAGGGGGGGGYGNGCGVAGNGAGGCTGQYTGTADGGAGGGGSSGQLKFGWIKGVFVRCLLNIWGVMLFLRLSWVVAQVGVAEAIVLILTTTAVTTITALSMSAISTNGLIKGGGTYYMISRSLGPEFGGSIGLIFSLANAVACALYVVGFCESMNDLLAIYDLQLIDGGIQDVRIMGSITLLLLMCIVVIGMEWEAKAQIGLLVILLAAIVDFLIGSVMGPKNDSDRARGFVGYNYTLLMDNFYSDYRYSDGSNHNFFSVFSIFFPAATGILAGANISGDLKDPQKSIPKGTILAIIVTSASYIGIAIICGATVMRQASGLFPNIECSSVDYCKYGLHNNKQIVALVSWQEGLIYAGCFAATLSSALASLVSAPKVFQALCRDKLYPAIEWFGRGYGPNNEPVRGYILTFVIAVAFILIGQLDLIAPLISNFFLAAYTLINFSTFHASLTKPVGWRPTFKYYNMWLSLIGTVLCVIIMFLISWVTALITFAALFSLYLIVSYRKPDVNWGSTTQAQAFKNAILSVQQLNNVEEHVKNYRPQILLLSGFPPCRQPLVDFAYMLTKNISMLICGHISYDRISQNSVNALHQKSNQWLTAHKTKAFYTLVDDMTFLQGAKALLQASGMGKLRPNILMMGYKSDWRTCPRKDLVSYFDVLHKALDMYLSVTILRLQNGFEVQKMTTVPSTATVVTAATNNATTPNNEERVESANEKSPITVEKKLSAERNYGGNSILHRNRSCSQVSCNGGSTAELAAGGGGRVTFSGTDQRRTSTFTTAANKPADPYAEQFLQKQKKGTIDVWWLYDDGGLTLLLPYILSTRQNWQDSRLRVFAIANKTTESEFEHRNMANLLAKFRIDYLDLTILPDITKKPQEKTRKQFDALIADFVETGEQTGADECKQSGIKKDNRDGIISEAEFLSVQDKTNRNLRIKELLEEHSKNATLIVMTLPVPRKNVVSAALYMAWIEMISRDMPPFLFVRGNQTSVLTFYS